MSAVIAVVAMSLAPKWRPRNGRPIIWKRIRPTTWRGPSGPRQPKKSRPRTEAGIIKGNASFGLCGSRCGFALPALRARGAARIRFRCRRFFLRLARDFFLRQGIESAVGRHRLEIAETAETALNGREVGE